MAPRKSKRSPKSPKKAPAKNAKKAPAKKAKKAPAKKAPAKKAKKALAKGGRAGGSARQAGKTVDDYVRLLPLAQKQAATKIRAIVRETAPAATEAIKWGQPVYEQGGPFAYMKAAREHLTFGFWRGTELSDPAGLLQGAGDRMRHVKITGSDLPLQSLRAFVAEAVALNAERGDPTRRG